MNRLLSAVAAILVAFPFHVRAQESPPSDNSVGSWVGDWESRGRPAGSMEMQVDVKDDKVFGQIRSTGAPECSLEWVKLAGVAKDNSKRGLKALLPKAVQMSSIA